MDRRTLWMRYVDFNKIKDLLIIVNQNNGKLRPNELEKIGEEKGVLLVERNKKAMNKSSKYHYRKVMEKLELVSLKDKTYHISEERLVQSIVNDSNLGEKYSPYAEECFSEIVIRNRDCRHFYFDYFIDDPDYDLKAWREKSKPIRIETKSNAVSNGRDMKNMEKYWVRLFNESNGKEEVLHTYDELSALLWGVRMWANSLFLTDEFMLSTHSGREVYPIKYKQYDKQLLKTAFLKSVNDLKDTQNSYLISLPGLILKMVKFSGTRIENVRKFLIELKNMYPSEIDFISTSKPVIIHSSAFKKQDPALLRMYLKKTDSDGSASYISHIRIYRKLFNIIIDGH